jgi:hypothetical protein
MEEVLSGSFAASADDVMFYVTGRFYVGQNLYISFSKGITPTGQQDWNSAVQAWYDEVQQFSNSSVSPFQ